MRRQQPGEFGGDGLQKAYFEYYSLDPVETQEKIERAFAGQAEGVRSEDLFALNGAALRPGLLEAIYWPGELARAYVGNDDALAKSGAERRGTSDEGWDTREQAAWDELEKAAAEVENISRSYGV
jgi:hypothetical protein